MHADDPAALDAPPTIIESGPAFGPKRWSGWRVFGVALAGIAALYIAQILIGVIVGIFLIMPMIVRGHGAPDTNTIMRAFNAPALFVITVPSEALMALLAVVLARELLHATPAALGVGRRPALKHLVIGLLGGGGLVVLSEGVAAVQEHFLGKHPQAALQIILSHHGLAAFALDFVSVALAAGVCEELMFRGVVFASLVQRIPAWSAMAISGVVFGLAHLDPWNLPALAAVGVGLGWLYFKTRSLWPNMVAHTVFNAFSLVLVYWFPQLAK